MYSAHGYYCNHALMWKMADRLIHELSESDLNIKTNLRIKWYNNIELGYRKILWFVSVPQISYLPQPLASANNNYLIFLPLTNHDILLNFVRYLLIIWHYKCALDYSVQTRVWNWKSGKIVVWSQKCCKTEYYSHITVLICHINSIYGITMVSFITAM